MDNWLPSTYTVTDLKRTNDSDDKPCHEMDTNTPETVPVLAEISDPIMPIGRGPQEKATEDIMGEKSRTGDKDGPKGRDS